MVTVPGEPPYFCYRREKEDLIHPLVNPWPSLFDRIEYLWLSFFNQANEKKDLTGKKFAPKLDRTTNIVETSE